MGKYYLISKVSNLSYSEYKGKSIRLSGQCPAKIDEVIVGLKDDSSVVKKITTFRDKKGNIIERAFDYSGEPLKNRLYRLFSHKADKNSDYVQTSSEVKEYCLPRKFMRKFLKQIKGNKFNFWTPVKVETHHVKKSIKANEKIHSMTRITDIAKGQTPTHTLVEFSHKNSEGNLTPKKYLQFRVNPQDYSVIQDSFVAQNVAVPKRDSYLGFRILDIDASKNPITKRFIKERGLADMNVKVGACRYREKNGRTIAARFAPWSGTVEYNRLFRHKSKSALVNTARHEVEHAWQYYLNARNGCYTDGWDILMYKKFGDICTSPSLRAEADKYSEAISSYVSMEKDHQKYFDSYIEALARKAGEAERIKYDTEGTEIRNAFPNIPKEML